LEKKIINFVLILTSYFRFIFVISIFIEFFTIIFDDANDPGSRSERLKMTKIGIPMIRKGKPGNCAGNGKAEMEFFNFKQFSKK
jgi:hypothetical protein